MFSERLNETRKLKGFTALYMANSLDMQIRGYRKYESGHSRPSFEALVKIADILGVPTDYLLGRDDYLKSLGVSVDVPLANLPRHPIAE